MNELVSIVVPIYNMGNSIETCVGSILEQDYSNIEVILVDDGSIDNSYEKCLALAAKDARVAVYHTENRGSGPARNYGIERASGKYIYFPDADDYMEPNAISVMVASMENGKHDLLVFGFTSLNQNGEIVRSKRYSAAVFRGENIRVDYAQHANSREKYAIQGAPWNKFFSLDVIRQNRVKYPPLRRHQDEAFIARYMCHASSVRFIQESLYIHYQNDLKKEWEKYPVDYIDAVIGLHETRKETILVWNKQDLKTHDLIEQEYITKVIKALELSFMPKMNLIGDERKQWIIQTVGRCKLDEVHIPKNLNRYHAMILQMLCKGEYSRAISIMALKVSVEKAGLLSNIKKFLRGYTTDAAAGEPDSAEHSESVHSEMTVQIDGRDQIDLNVLAVLIMLPAIIRVISVMFNVLGVASTSVVTTAIYLAALGLIVLKVRTISKTDLYILGFIYSLFAINYILFPEARVYTFSKSMLIVYSFYLIPCVISIRKIRAFKYFEDVFYPYAIVVTVSSGFMLLVLDYAPYTGYMEFSYGILPAVCVLYYVFRKSKGKKRVVSAMLFAAGMMQIFVYGARASVMFVVALAVAFEVLRTDKPNTGKIKILIGCLLAVTILLLLGEQIAGILGSIPGLKDSRIIRKLASGKLFTSPVRNVITVHCLERLRTMGLAISGFWGDRAYCGGESWPHNIFLEILMSYGWLFGIVAIILLSAVCLNALMKTGSARDMAVYVCFALLARYLISGSYIQEGSFWIGLFVMIAMVEKEDIQRYAGAVSTCLKRLTKAEK